MHTRHHQAFQELSSVQVHRHPIFAVNAKTGNSPNLRTTGQAFGDCLHSYGGGRDQDGNVLPFRIGYVDTVRRKEDVRDEQVYGIDAAGR